MITKSEKNILPPDLAEKMQQYSQESLRSEENVAGGRKYLSIKKGHFSFEGERLENDHFIAVIVDHVMEQTFYRDKYKDNHAAIPECYALGRHERDLKPHSDCLHPVHSDCASCPNYQWGSGENKGKRCQTRRRLAIIFAGDTPKKGETFVHPTADKYKIDDIAYLRLPPTSIANFSNYVRKVALVAKRPPFGVYTKIALSSERITPYEVTFEMMLDAVPGKEQLESIIPFHETVSQDICFSYPRIPQVDEAPAPKEKTTPQKSYSDEPQSSYKF